MDGKGDRAVCLGSGKGFSPGAMVEVIRCDGPVAGGPRRPVLFRTGALGGQRRTGALPRTPGYLGQDDEAAGSLAALSFQPSVERR